MRQILCATFTLLLAVTGAAQENGPTGEEPLSYEAQVERFFAHVEDGDYRQAVEDFFGTHPWAATMRDELSALKAQFSSLPELAGEPRGWDLVVEQRFADSFVLLHYIVKFDRSPISLYFTFYRPEDTWQAYSFEYKEDLKEMAAEMAQMKLTFPHLAEPAGGDDAPQARAAGSKSVDRGGAGVMTASRAAPPPARQRPTTGEETP